MQQEEGGTSVLIVDTSCGRCNVRGVREHLCREGGGTFDAP